jgi:hypothetical protein
MLGSCLKSGARSMHKSIQRGMIVPVHEPSG